MASNENELVRDWQDKIAKGEATKRKWRDTFRLDDLDKYYEGHQVPAWWPQDNFLVINLIFANIKTQLDGLKSATPRFYVRPARTFTPSLLLLNELEQQSSLREATLNYHVREASFKREFMKGVLDAFLSFGVLKTFYQPYHRENRRRGHLLLGPNNQPILEPGTSQPMVEPNEELYRELFFSKRRDPADILFDPFADSIENIEWVSERIEMTLEEAKSNKLFKNTEDLKSLDVRQEDKEQEKERKIGNDVARPLSGGNSSLPGLDKRREQQIVYIREIYDLVKKRIICIADGYDKILRDDPLPEGIEGHPYCFLWFVDRRNSPYPVPYIWHQLGPQDEYNITRNQIVTHRKRFNRKYTCLEGAVDDDELAKVEEPYDGVVIKVKVDGKPIQAIEDPALDQAVYFDVQMLRRDFMDISGEAIPDSDVAKIEKATVAQWLSNRQENRKRGILSSVADLLEQVARKLMLLYENEMTLPMAINIAGENGQNWQNLSPDAFLGGHGEFIYEVAVDSLVPLTPETERASWVGFLQFVAMNPTIMMSPALAQKTAKMFGVEDKELVQEVVGAAQRLQEQQMLQGGQPGQPSMSGDMSKALGVE